MLIRKQALVAMVMAAGLAGGAWAQTPAATPASTPAAATPAAVPAAETKTAEASRSTTVSTGAEASMHPGAATLSRLMRVVSADFADNTVEQCLNYVRDVAGVDIEVIWAENGSEGLDREKSLTLSAKNMTILALLEKVLDKAAGDVIGTGATWQMTDGGTLQVGLKSSLNKFRRLEIYDITDMLFEVKDKTNVPSLDIQQAFQQSGQGGGGGGQAPFQQTGQQNQQRSQEDQAQTRQAKVTEVKNLITSLVETDQWADNGGDGGTITAWQGTFLVNAPDYMHRQINGYPYWDSNKTAAGKAGGRRYVTLDSDVQRSSYDRFRQVPVTGAAGTGR